jgi:hypothetical protein
MLMGGFSVSALTRPARRTPGNARTFRSRVKTSADRVFRVANKVAVGAIYLPHRSAHHAGELDGWSRVGERTRVGRPTGACCLSSGATGCSKSQPTAARRALVHTHAAVAGYSEAARSPCGAATWSPSGTSVAYFAHDGIHVLDLATDREHTVRLLHLRGNVQMVMRRTRLAANLRPFSLNRPRSDRPPPRAPVRRRDPDRRGGRPERNQPTAPFVALAESGSCDDSGRCADDVDWRTN